MSYDTMLNEVSMNFSR